MFFSLWYIALWAAALFSSALAAPVPVCSLGLRVGSDSSSVPAATSTSGVGNVGTSPSVTSSIAVISSAVVPTASSIAVISSAAVPTTSAIVSSAVGATTTTSAFSSSSAVASATTSSTAATATSSSSSSGPYFVVYSDAWVSGETGPPDVSDIEGYNVFILSFLLTSGAVDQASEWASLDSDTRSTIKSQYEAAGIKLLVSAFGSTDTPTTSGADAVDTANTMAAWVIEYGLDGIDVDYEDFDAIDDSDDAVQWLVDFTTQLRSQLPAGEYIITHAPVAPWFSDSSDFANGAYLEVNQQVGDLIDWYNVQFYNQGETEYTTCDGLLTESSSTWPNTSLFQIAAAGVDLDKLVIGKPATSSDATDGYMDTATLATCVAEAQEQGWNAGVMVWEYPDADASWISTVRGSAFPIDS